MPEAVDLSMIASELAARCFQADDGVVMRTDLAQSAVIEGDPTDARRVVGNLLENARKYGRSEHDDIARITLQTRVAHGKVELSVMDEGRGIPDDQVAHYAAFLSRRCGAHTGERHRPRHGDRAAPGHAAARHAALAQPHASSRLRSNDRFSPDERRRALRKLNILNRSGRLSGTLVKNY